METRRSEATEIVVTERPASVSWEEISRLLKTAHAENVRQGIVMRYPQLPPEQLYEKTEGRGGTLFVALDGDRLVGTGAVVRVDRKIWCGDGAYAYCSFGAVLPEFRGKSIYPRLIAARENWARESGISRMLMDTNERNRTMLSLCRKNDWREVDYRIYDGHGSVMLVKWLGGCPYSRLHCQYKFQWMKWGRIRRKWKTKRSR